MLDASLVGMSEGNDQNKIVYISNRQVQGEHFQ